MEKYTKGQTVALISDKNVTGVVFEVIPGGTEPQYRVFTMQGIQTYYESQICPETLEENLLCVGANHFHAGITAALIRTPTISSLYSLNSAQIDFIPHQFRPVLKMIKSDRPRLLIADGVGVGKTIEAGLILKELEARTNLKSVLIICPRPLVAEHKWQTEMKRFGEEFTELDGKAFRYCIRQMKLEEEWPSRYNKVIVPYSLFDEGNVHGTAKHLGLMDAEVPKFDLVIVDEAHHIRNTATYAYRAVNYFCDAAEAVVLLTATPVQLEYNDLFTLLNLLRPDLVIDKATFRDMAEPNCHINRAATMVRRKQQGWQCEAESQLQEACDTPWGKKVFQDNPQMHEAMELLEQGTVSAEERVRLISDIENLHTFSGIISRTRRRDIGNFTVRKPFSIMVPFTSAQKELHDSILQVIHEMLSREYCTENTKFMMTTIRRQTASCLFGLVPMLEDILYRHAFEVAGEEELFSPLSEKQMEKPLEEKIQEILEMAETLPPTDHKLDALMEILASKSQEEKNKVMVFSSFRHTLRYLENKLRAAGIRVGLIHGGVDDEQRRLFRKRFDPAQTPADSPEALDVLLFSEVGCEGLDYQFCDCMVNYDLPWNPMRVEQRIGRIDRNGQTSESVSIYNLVTPGTVDADIYERCLMRIGVFHDSVGDCESILGELTTEVCKVASSFELTEQERRDKIQQITDNKIREIKEQQDLEAKQRDLFGLQVPESDADREVRDATNIWLSPEKIQNMVVCYLKQTFGEEREYISGTKALKKLRLSQNDRLSLLEEIKRSRLPKSEAYRTWRRWLESGEQTTDITFDQNCWKENPKAVFLTVTHPLVRRAAENLQKKEKTVTALRVYTNEYPAGEYPFVLYQWKLSGERETLQLVPLSGESGLNEMLQELLKHSEDAGQDPPTDRKLWDKAEQLHHAVWEKALAEHKEKTKEMIRYKEASLRTSHAARMAVLQEQVAKYPENRTYVQMTTGKIRAAQEDFDLHMRQLQNAEQRADILFDLLAYGLLIVEQGEKS